MTDKIDAELVATKERVDVLQPEFKNQHWDLSDCTFIIPLRIESRDRMRNIITVLIYLLRNFKTKVIVKEVDKESIFKESVQPALEEALKDFQLEGLTHIFEQSDEYTFHRTKIINDMLWMVDTPYVANYDCDILLPKTSYAYAVNLLKNGYEKDGERLYPKVVYPYGNGMYQAQLKASDEEVSEFMNSEFDFSVFKTWRAYDAKFGFVQFFDTETYKKYGGENEGFVAYGYEDDERHFRFFKLSHVVRMNDERIFHLEHERSPNSWFNNPHIESNRKLWEKLKSCSKEELELYYEHVKYAKIRRAVPVEGQK